MSETGTMTETPFSPADSQPGDAVLNPPLLQVQNRLFHLAAQIDQIQEQLQALRSESESQSGQVSALVHHFTGAGFLGPLQSGLAEVATQLTAYEDRLATLSSVMAALPGREQMEHLLQTVEQNITQTARREQLDELVQTVAKQGQLERLIEVVAGQKQIDEVADNLKKLTRTQFKSNTLLESKEGQVETVLETLREIATRREQAQENQMVRTSHQKHETSSTARAEFAAELLPSLDSIELALENGAAIFERQRPKVEMLSARKPAPAAMLPAPIPAPAPPPGFWRRLFGGSEEPAMELPRSQPTVSPAAPLISPMEVQDLFSAIQDASTAWLKGLELVRHRFLALLQGEGIEPIDALNQPFDPRLHVAVETEARNSVAPNTVIRVLRKGYRQNNRVLRYAEVAVSRSPEA